MKEASSIFQQNTYANIQMTTDDFNRMSKFVYSELGIKMPVEKKVMLQSRLLKRLSELRIDNFKQYLDFVFSKEGEASELRIVTDLVTTNKTDFFREPSHFDFLRETILPELALGEKRLKVWSAGCSSGEEPYTIAISINEFLEKFPGFDFNILATDLSTRMLEKASLAIYGIDRVRDIPLSIKKKYLLKSKDPNNKTVRIVPSIRKKVTFQRMNFMDQRYAVENVFDIVFCRNVIIYFDRPTQEAVINKLVANLKPGGYFFLGHSESITNMNVPLKHIKPTIFQKI